MTKLNDWEQEEFDNTVKGLEDKIKNLKEELSRSESSYLKLKDCTHQNRVNKGGFTFIEVQCEDCGYSWFY